MSTPLAELPPTFFDRAADNVVNFFRAQKLKRAKAKLEKELGQIVETANGHQAKGLPTGSPAYVALHRQAMTKIDAFCTTFKVPRLSIEQDVPVLRELEALTHAPTPAAVVGKGIGMMVMVVVGAILLGCVIGLASAGSQWVVHLLVH